MPIESLTHITRPTNQPTNQPNTQAGGAAVGGHHSHLCVVAARSERFPRLGRKKAGKGQEGRKRMHDLPPPLPRRTP
jgi:hypothetical protein